MASETSEFNKWLQDNKLIHLADKFKNASFQNLNALKVATSEDIDAIIQQLDISVFDKLSFKAAIQSLSKQRVIIHEDEYNALDVIENSIDKIKNLTKNIQSEQEKMNQKIDENIIKKEIENGFNTIVKELNERKQKLLTNTNKMVLYKADVLNTQLNEYQTYLKKLLLIKEECNELLSQPIAFNKISDRKAKILSLRDIVTSENEQKVFPLPCTLQFHLSGYNDLSLQIFNLGTIAKYNINIQQIKNNFFKKNSVDIEWNLQCLNPSKDILALFGNNNNNKANKIHIEWKQNNEIFEKNLNWKCQIIAINKLKKSIKTMQTIKNSINQFECEGNYDFRLKLVYFDDADNVHSVCSDTHCVKVQYLSMSDRWRYVTFGFVRTLLALITKIDKVLFASNTISELIIKYLSSALNIQSSENLIGYFNADSFELHTQTWHNLNKDAAEHIISNKFIQGRIKKQSDENGVCYIYGGIGDNITFPENFSLSRTYTLIFCSRYNGTQKKRILNSTNYNWLSGHWAGRSGVAHHNTWITQHESVNDNHTNEWIVSTDQLNLYRCNGMDKTKQNANGNLTGSTKVKLKINGGQCNEPSDWAIGHIFIFDSQLNVDEIEDIEQYLMTMYNVYNPVVDDNGFYGDEDEFDDVNVSRAEYEEKNEEITDKIRPVWNSGEFSNYPMSHMYANNGNYWCSEQLIGNDADVSIVFDVERYNVTGVDIQFQATYACAIVKVYSSEDEKVAKKKWRKVTQKRNMQYNGSLNHIVIDDDSQPKYLRFKFEAWSNGYVGVQHIRFYGDSY